MSNRKVSMSEFRRHLSEYVQAAKRGSEIEITSRGNVVARVTPARDPVAEARTELMALRGKAFVGDVISPIDVQWDAEHLPWAHR